MRTPVLTTAEIRAVEAQAALTFGPSLMERAGLAAAQAARARVADPDATILVVAGPGNNGGDAWVAAAHLRESFQHVTVLDASSTPPKAAEAVAAQERFVVAGGLVVIHWSDAIRPALIVDGLLGIGLTRDADGELAELIGRINASGVPVLAIDVPSGLDADTGRVRGVAVNATCTITFIAAKPGLFTGDGVDCCGTVVVDRLGLEDRYFEGALGSLLTMDAVHDRIPQRRRNTHKGIFGTLGIVGGNRGMVGAALLAARAGLLGGAGRVYVGLIVVSDSLAADPVHPELMMRSIDDAMKADVIVAGPGAGRSPSATSASHFDRAILPATIATKKPLVLDADALNAIALHESIAQSLATRKSATILTPHPAEAARMLHRSNEEIQNDRLGAALEMAKRFNAHVVLKGAGSICAFPDGRWSINTTGNPGLASGGTGDVLAGLIGALLCQGLDAERALELGVCLHGAAADDCVSQGIGPVGLTATDVLTAARRLINQKAWT
jgi:ADP-dependent NAD(P)H-hydrate dehydratase / NAD(P)H-hydrate epimerase